MHLVLNVFDQRITWSLGVIKRTSNRENNLGQDWTQYPSILAQNRNDWEGPENQPSREGMFFSKVKAKRQEMW